MTTESMRIAIAEACGTLNLPKTAEKIEHLDWRGEDVGCYFLAHYKDGSARPGYTGEIPDYRNDITARKAAWRGLTDEQKWSFRAWVAEIARRESIWAEEAEFEFWPEIFLRTIGKYIES